MLVKGATACDADTMTSQPHSALAMRSVGPLETIRDQNVNLQCSYLLSKLFA